MRNIVKYLFAALLIGAGIQTANAANGIIETKHYDFCTGDTIEFDNGAIKVFKDTVIRDTIAVVDPYADSIRIYIFNRHPKYRITESRELEAGSSFVWRGQTIRVPGTYERVYQSQFGCDSAYVLTVTPKMSSPALYVVKDTTICEGNFVSWRGLNHSITGTYIDTAHAIAPSTRDTLYVLYLHVEKNFYKTERVEFQTFPVTYRGLTFNSAGTQDAKYMSVNGCDSIYHVVAYSKPIEDTKTVTICENSSYKWDVTGETYTSSGTYQKVEKAQSDPSRDSIIHTLVLTVKEVKTSYLNATICDGGFYYFNGHRYTEAGIHRDTFRTDGCPDSVVVLTLNVSARDTSIYSKELAVGETFTWNGTTYSEPGTYTRTFRNRLGCDSVAQLVLTRHHVDYIDTIASICPGDSLVWHGIVGYTTRTYSRSEELPNGDVRIYRLNLTVRNLKELYKTYTFCQGGSVSFYDQIYTKAGTYDYYYTCDTLYHVTVKVNPVSVVVMEDSFDGKSGYTWTFKHNGETKTYNYTKEGTYEVPFPNATTGCNDIYRLILRVDSLEYHFYDSVALCYGEPFEWQGYTNLSTQHVGETTPYQVNYKTKSQKDSVYHLKLTVHPKAYTEEKVEFLTFPVTYRHQTIAGPGTYYDSLKTVHGCDSVVRFDVQQKVSIDEKSATFCAGSYYEWQGMKLSVAGQYNVTEKTYNGLYDSVYHRLTLSELPTSTGIAKDTTICRGNYITFGGRAISEPGVYYDTLVAANGCDSIVSKRLNVTDTHVTTQVFRRDSGELFHWEVTGKDYPAPYTKDTVLKSALGCDSIVRLILTANRVDTVEASATICSGEYKEWHGSRYYESGTFDNVETLDNGDKVVFRLHLTVTGVTKIEKPVTYTVCQGESVHFFDSIYSKPGVYYYPYSCDSIYKITVIVTPSHVEILHDSFNGIEPYTWKLVINGTPKDSTITEAGTYDHKEYNSATGCNDIYRLYLSVDTSSYYFDEKKSICEGESYSWHGRDFTNLAVGTYDYYDPHKTAAQKDSTYHLQLTVNPVIRRTERLEFAVFPAFYLGERFDHPGDSKEITFTSISGCDSIVTVIANRQVIREVERISICAGDYYDWRGKRYTNGGEYHEVLKSQDGTQDSIYYDLYLTVNNIPDTYINVSICRGNSYTFGGTTYTEGGIYRHTFPKNGCDSTVILSLNVLDVDTTTFIHRLEEGATYHWDVTDKDYPTPGVYDTLLKNSLGCDSIVRLVLTVHRIDTIRETRTICPGETYYWHGIVGRETHVYQQVEQQADGSHVVYELDLKVLKQIELEQKLYICAGESASYKGSPVYTSPNTYSYRYSCDTLYRIVVIQQPTEVHSQTVVFSGKEPYSWKYMKDGVEHTDPISTPGTYEHYNYNPETGCNDIYRLILVIDETEYNFVDSLTICEGDDFTWRGKQNLSHQGVGETKHYEDPYKTAAGKDSIYHLYLTVIPAEHTTRTIPFCGQTTFRGVTYTESGTLYDTVASSTGCRLIERINLVKQPSYFYSDTATIVQGEILNWHGFSINTDGTYRDPYQSVFGCDSIYELIVHLNEAAPHSNTYTTKVSICDGDFYEWRGNKYYTQNIYRDSVDSDPDPDTGHPDSIFVLNLTVWPSFKDTIVRHMYACGKNATILYDGVEYTKDTVLKRTYRTIHNCDSVVKVFLHFNKAYFKSDTISVADNKLPYNWVWETGGDTAIYNSGTYIHDWPAEGGCFNRQELVLTVHPTFFYRKDTAICEEDAPFYWLDGPDDHKAEPLSHAAGYEPQTYEYKYTASTGADSIYQLNLIIYKTAKTTERHYLCPGDEFYVNNHRYFIGSMVSDSVYRDTLYVPNPKTPGCDSIVYYEIYQYPKKEHTEYRILRKDSSFVWNGQNISHSNGSRTYSFVTKNVGPGGCDSTSYLKVIAEQLEVRTECALDTPFVWRDDSIYTAGLWMDTVYDSDRHITEFHTLDLKLMIPIDTTIYLHGCKVADDPLTGVTWRGHTYSKDTTFIDTLDCSYVYDVRIKMDTSYVINIVDTLCEHELPYILGRINPDTIWAEGFYQHTEDTTMYGCDSIINLTLRIIPYLTKTDSTFRCEDSIAVHPVILGDTVSPAFAFTNGGLFADKWKGKWHGVSYTKDTIVYNCDSSYHHHIIVRPRQKTIPTMNYAICQGDSVQLFWPNDEQWIKTPGIYFDTVKTSSPWTDNHHGSPIVHDDRCYACDSITRWIVTYADTIHEDTTIHIHMGDSLMFDNQWRYVTGTYDSIGYAHDMDSAHNYCKYVMTLHLFVDSTYYYRDSINICSKPGKEIQYKWNDGYTMTFKLPTKDTARHYIDTLHTQVYRFDSIYDLYVDFRIQPHKVLFDTICEGDSLRFDIHKNNSTTERWLHGAGVFYDTIPAVNNCDSVLELHLFVRNRVVTKPKHVQVTDRELPYAWEHHWKENGLPKDSTDSLLSTGLYTFTMPNKFGCDSIDSLYFTVHYTHVFRDTIDTCAPLNTTLQHKWSTNYVQTFTTPNRDSLIHYYDTLNTRIKLDSIYDLYVRFHQTYVTHVYDTICEGDSAYINVLRNDSKPMQYYKSTGVYRDTVPSYYECDSVIVLHLQVWPKSPKFHQVVDIADVDTPYLWAHAWQGIGKIERDTDTLFAAGEYRRILPNIHGCDSIDSLSLIIHKTYKITDDTINICSKEIPYTWRGLDNITKTGDYTYGVKTKENYDSVHYVHINVWPQKYDTITAHICEGDSMRWGLSKKGQPFFAKKTGLYNDTLATIHGCDSILVLRLTVYPKYFKDTTVHIADIDTPYVWNHFDAKGTSFGSDPLSASGRYGFRFASQYGCDSIDSLTLFVHQTYRIKEDTLNICESETPYTWHNLTNITVSGDYVYRGKTKENYDSIRYIHINVWPQTYDTISAHICEGDSMRWGLTKKDLPFFAKKSGLYNDTLPTNHGCDSIRVLRLTVYPRYFKDTTVHIADTDTPYVWNHFDAKGTPFGSDPLSASGRYGFRFPSQYGCDSIDSLRLVIHQTYRIKEDTLNICDSETPYTWHNLTNITVSGDYVYRGKTTENYDSIRYIHINVAPQRYDTTRVAICAGDSFPFNGQWYTKAGVYDAVTQGSNGCDSTHTLILSVNETYYRFIHHDMYVGEKYNFFGTDLETTGTYSHKAKTPAGCDSITDLELVVHPLIDTTVTVCAPELPYRWVNKWKPEKVTLLERPGIYHDDTTFVNGKRTFWSIDFRVNEPQYTTINRTICAGSSYTFNNRHITKGGIYTETLTADNGCDSIVTLILQVNKPVEDTIYRTICAGSTYHFHNTDLSTQGEYRDTVKTLLGCDSVIVLKLQVLPTYHNVITRSIYAGDTVHFHDSVFAVAGRYQYRHTSSFGCDSIIELNLVVNKLFDDSVAVCQSELPYLWKGKEIWKDGIYRDTTSDGNGQRVITSIKVLVLPVLRKAEQIQITICEGDSVRFGLTKAQKPRFVSKQGLYYDTLTSKQYGCDSIVTLNLQVLPRTFRSETVSIFEGDSTLFYGEWLKTAGTYVHQEDNGNNCYSTHELVVTVLQVAHRDTTAYVCEHDLPFIWNGENFNASGDYERRTIWTTTEHVITTLHLTVNPQFYGERNVSLCDGSTFTYKGKSYKRGEFYDTIRTQHGCDSIIRYIITVHPTFDRIDTVHISDKQTFKFDGRDLNQSGYYEAAGKTKFGCDSVQYLVLIVHPSYYNYDSIDICQGDTMDWHGQKIFKSGLYSDSLLTKDFSFDSVYQVRVVVHPKYFIEQQYEITEGNPTYIHGINISQPGVYYDSLYTIHGCDSVYRVVVNWARKFTQHWDVTVCQGEEYKFFGRSLTHTGEYTYNSPKNDSTIYLKFTVNPASITDKLILVTKDDWPYIYNGRTYDAPGLYPDTFVNHYKCDSIIRVNIVQTDHYSEWEQVPLCPGQTLKIEGQTITEAGSYTFQKRSKSNGPLDSLYRVEVYNAPDYESFDTLTVCEGDSVFLAGKQLTRAGSYTANLKTKLGCDSILHLHLIINPSYLFLTQATITDYMTYSWRGKDLNKQDTYEQTYPTVNDCDSTYRLDLTVIPTQRITVTDSICFRDTLRWRDHIITDPGTYNDTICNLAANTSIIYSLQLGVVTPTIITSASVTETAADVESFKIHFSYSGMRPATYNIVFDELAHSEGFKDIYNKPFGSEIVAEVPMPKKDKVVYQEHTAYVKPNYYTMRLALDNNVCGLSRSDSLSLLIKYPSWIIEQNWDNVVAPLKADYNGGYEFGAYRWFINDTEFENGGLPYVYTKSLNPGDRVVLYATRIGESYAIPTEPLTITRPVPDVFPNPVLVYPTSTPKAKHTVTLKAEQNGSYFVYSNTGQLYSTGTFESGEQQIDIPATSGCCLIRATTADGFILTEKIVVY